MKKAVIQIGVLFAVVFVLGAVLWKSKAKKDLEKKIEEAPSILVRSSAETLGPASAKVHIVEFMDPGCETCRAFHPIVQALLAKHEGKVKLSVRYLPLHQGADTMVKILEAARKQSKYWETLHLMFETQPVWASHHHPQPEKIWPLLPKAGVDVDAIRRDMGSAEIAKILEKDMSDARALGIRKTPSFFVNGEPLTSFGRQQLNDLVDKAVAASY